MKEFIEKLIGRLEEEKSDWNDDYNVPINRAIKIVNQLAEEYKSCHKPCTDCEEYDLVRNHCPKFCKVIKETVKEIEENYNSWIPCSERLPEKNGQYLIQNIHGEICVAHYNYNSPCTYRAFFNGYTQVKNVIAWQPLPAPYQSKGE